MEASELTKGVWTELLRLNVSDPVYRRLASTPAPRAMLVDMPMLTEAIRAALDNMVESDVREVEDLLRSLAQDMQRTASQIEIIAREAGIDLGEQSGEW